MFSKVVGLVRTDVQYDDSGRSKGYAILKFENNRRAADFIKEYDGVCVFVSFYLFISYFHQIF